ncbi:hypothetical protein BDR26DRAFT_930214 [Obelidium mucronatum]|nr:hypothetical protein BDR26DRAFT_930214 [Obelidium mucronatum]
MLLAGVAIVVSMNALSSFGVNLQALALQRRQGTQRIQLRTNYAGGSPGDDEEPLLSTTSLAPSAADQLLPPWLEPWLWYIGFVCYIIPQLFGSILALNFISPILLAPLGSSGLVFNVFFSSLLVGTRVGIWDWVATALIILGGVIVSLFGNLDVEIQAHLFRIYFPAVTSLLFLALFFAILFESRKHRLEAIVQQLENPISDDENGMDAQNRILQLKKSGSLLPHSIGFLYSTAGGISAAMTLTIVKCGLNLVASAINGDGLVSLSLLISTESEVLMAVFLLLSLVLSVLLQLVTLNKAIVFISPLIAIPVFYTFFTSLSVSNTLVIVFSIPGLELPENIAFTIQMAVVGVSVIVTGVWVLSYSSVSSSIGIK